MYTHRTSESQLVQRCADTADEAQTPWSTLQHEYFLPELLSTEEERRQEHHSSRTRAQSHHSLLTTAGAMTGTSAPCDNTPTTKSRGASFEVLCDIAACLPPLAPLSLLAASPHTRLSLELRERGCVLPGNLCFERRLGPHARTPDAMFRGTNGDKSNTTASESVSAYLSPPRELLQHLTLYKPTLPCVPDRPAAARPTGTAKRSVTAAAEAAEAVPRRKEMVQAVKTKTLETVAPKDLPESDVALDRGLQYALWWLKYSPLPVSLTLHCFDPDDVRALTSQLQSLSHKIVLRELVLHGQQVSEITPFLPHCAGVQALALRNTHLTSEKLSMLPKSCHHVERLSLCMSTSVSDTEFLGHQSLRTIRDLDLSYTQVTEREVSRDVSTLIKLCRLSLEGCRKIEGLQWLQRLTKLRELDLAYSSITDTSLTALQCCPELVKLDLQWCGRLTNLQYLVGAPCESLRELNLGETSMNNEGLEPLKNFSLLEWLSLEGCSLVSNINMLGGLSKLRNLSVSCTRITSEGMASLSQCKSLQVVCMRQCYRLNDVCCLGKLQLLEVLDLSDCPVTNDGVAALRDARSLRKLLLESCRAITDVNFLSGIEHLTELDLHHTNVDEAGSVGLAHCRQLTSLIIHSANVHSLQQWMAAAFLLHLKRLDLTSPELTSDGLIFLAFCPFLETLSLRGCKKITSADFLMLCNPAAGEQPVHYGGDGSEVGHRMAITAVTAAASTMHSNEKLDSSLFPPAPPPQMGLRRNLLEITLCDTAITDSGLQALMYCVGLERVRLACCKNLTNVNLLRWLPQLKDLDLSGTSVTTEGLARLSPQANLPIEHMMEVNNDFPVSASYPARSRTWSPRGVRGAPVGCSALERLWLQSCPSVGNVQVLCGFPNLKELFLTGTLLQHRERDMLTLYQRNTALKKIHHDGGGGNF